MKTPREVAIVSEAERHMSAKLYELGMSDDNGLAATQARMWLLEHRDGWKIAAATKVEPAPVPEAE